MQVPHEHIWYFAAHRGCTSAWHPSSQWVSHCSSWTAPLSSCLVGLCSSCVAVSLNLTAQGVSWSQSRPHLLTEEFFVLLSSLEELGVLEAAWPSSSQPLCSMLIPCWRHFHVWPIYFEFKTLELKGWRPLRMWGRRGRWVRQSLLCARSLCPFLVLWGVLELLLLLQGRCCVQGMRWQSSRSSLPALTRCVYFPTDAFVPVAFPSASSKPDLILLRFPDFSLPIPHSLPFIWKRDAFANGSGLFQQFLGVFVCCGVTSPTLCLLLQDLLHSMLRRGMPCTIGW